MAQIRAHSSCDAEGDPRRRSDIPASIEDLKMQSIIVGRSAKRAAVVATIIVASFPLYGCYTPMERALGGGAIGGLGGAGIGALASGGAAYATLGGAAVGAAAGSLVGLATTPRYYRRRYY
jgi:hypothetical protein